MTFVSNMFVNTFPSGHSCCSSVVFDGVVGKRVTKTHKSNSRSVFVPVKRLVGAL